MNKTNIGANTNVQQIFLDIAIILFCYAGSVLICFDMMDKQEGINLLVLVALFSLIYILANKESRVYNITTFYYLDRIQRKSTRSFLMATVSIFAILYCTDGHLIEPKPFLIFLLKMVCLLYNFFLCAKIFFFQT